MTQRDRPDNALPARRFRPAIAAVLLAPTLAAGAVYRCTRGEAPPTFSQFPCGDGAAMVIEPLHTVRIPPLSDAEKRLLDEFDQRRREARETRARARKRAARAERALRDERRQRCDDARSAHAALDRQRRKGYSIDEARELDRRDEELAAAEKQNC